MKKNIIIGCLAFAGLTLNAATYKVADITEYNKTVKTLQPGDSIVLSKGVWKDAELVFFGEGTEAKPITLTVEEYGKTTIEGQSKLNMYGKYLVVDGLAFVNGYSPSNVVIEMRKGTQKAAYNSVIRNCVIDNYNKPDRSTQDAWVNVWGQHNKVEYCYFGGKTNLGVTLIVWPNGEGHNQNYHHIYRNYFGTRPRLGSNGGETIRIGTSHVSMENSNTIVEGNYFEHCSGEVEIISVKSCENRIIDNTFFECEGSVVLRHGHRNEVSGNYFLGNMRPFTGGVRIINEGQRVINNYFYGLRGKDFRAALVMMNGVPNSPANRYHQVKDAVVMFNTWVNCELPWQLCVGSDEERTLAPINTKIVDNLIYAPEESDLIKAFDKTDGILFRDNILLSSQGYESSNGGIKGEIETKGTANNTPIVYTKTKASVAEPSVKTDIEGHLRGKDKWVGAFEPNGSKATITPASKDNCGPTWFTPGQFKKTSLSIKVTKVPVEKDALAKAIRKSQPGETLVLESGVYINSKKMHIPHSLTIKSDNNIKTRPIVKVDAEETNTVSIFEIGSDLIFNIDGIALDGGVKQKIPAKYAFTTIKESSSSYNIYINNCEIYDFRNEEGGCVYKAYKNSFADTLSVTNTIIRDCFRGFALNDEKENKGLYNAEYMIFDNVVFQNITQWAIDFLRGGNDESTLGGNLMIDHSIFDNVNNRDGQWMIKQTGLINIDITNSIFTNSPLAKGPIRLIGRHANISYSDIYDAGKISTSDDAEIGIGMIYVNPQFKKEKPFVLSEKSPLRGKSKDGQNIGLKL